MKSADSSQAVKYLDNLFHDITNSTLSWDKIKHHTTWVTLLLTIFNKMLEHHT